MAGRRIGLLKNLGPVSERQLAEIGIHDEEALRALGAVEAWRRLKFRFPREIGAVALYALEGALRDCHWNALPDDTKAQLKAAANFPLALPPGGALNPPLSG